MALPANSTVVPPEPVDPAAAASANNFTCTPYNASASAPEVPVPAATPSAANTSAAAAVNLAAMAVSVRAVAMPGGNPYGSWKLWTTDPYNFTVLSWNATEAEVAAAASGQLLWVAGQQGYSVSVVRTRCAGPALVSVPMAWTLCTHRCTVP